MTLEILERPGRGSRFSEALVGDLPALAEDILTSYGRLFGGPFALFGHSFGALLGFEVARRLAAEGCPPERLFASAASPPSRPSEKGRHLMSDAELVAEIVAMGGVPPQLLDDPDAMAFFLPPVRADMQALETHTQPKHERLPIPITVIAAEDDPAVDHASLAGWEAHGTGVTQVRLKTPAGHMYLESHAQDLIEIILRTLSP